MTIISRPDAYLLAWEQGWLSYLMTRTQREAYDRWRNVDGRVFVLRCTRRFGKTFMLSLMCWMTALSKPGSVIRYVAPTKLHGRQFVIPAFRWVADRSPPHVRPKFNAQDNRWEWPNGSVCHLGSAETFNDCEKQVGTECHFAALDEAAKYPIGLLTHLITSVISPQFLTTRGRMLIASTPPISRAHDFTQWCTVSAQRGALSQYTIDDVDHISQEAKDEAIRKSVDEEGFDHNAIRREYYCEDVIDETRAIVPEFARVKAEIVREPEIPEWRDVYVAADFGFHDLTVVLFAFYDFRRARIVVEDELSFSGASGLEVGAAILERERKLWGHDAKPFRYADAPAQLLADLAHTRLGPGVAFAPVAKDDREAALNALRMAIQRKEIEIAPRCRTLIAHLEYGTWNSSRTSFDRAEGYGHWDAIDALKYLIRHVQRSRNPHPYVLPEQADPQRFGVVVNQRKPNTLANVMSSRAVRRQ